MEKIQSNEVYDRINVQPLMALELERIRSAGEGVLYLAKEE
jgi:hypothetical protein